MSHNIPQLEAERALAMCWKCEANGDYAIVMR